MPSNGYFLKITRSFCLHKRLPHLPTLAQIRKLITAWAGMGVVDLTCDVAWKECVAIECVSRCAVACAVSIHTGCGLVSYMFAAHLGVCVSG